MKNIKTILDWKSIEKSFLEEAYLQVLEVFEQNKEKTFYALAFHSSYRDMEVFYAPVLAMNSIDNQKDEDGNIEFSPPEWEFDDIIGWCGSEIVADLMQMVLSEAKRKDTDEHWEKIEKKFDKMILKVVNQLYKKLKKSSQTTKDFIVYYDFLDDEEAFLRASVPEKLFLKFFPYFDKVEMERQRVFTLTTHEQVTYYFNILLKHDGLISSDEAEEKLIAFQKDALDILVEHLNSEENGWRYAYVLGKIGIASKEVVKALEQEVLKGNAPSSWSANALGLLGQVDFLLEHAANTQYRKNVLNGIAIMYKSWVDYVVNPTKLDFEPLQKALEQNSDFQDILEDELQIGRGYRTINLEEIDVALEGLNSSWVLIRQLSVCYLGNRALGKKEAKKILPKLIECLEDKESAFRRLAIINIGAWSRQAVTYIPNIEKLYNDENEKVREMAHSIVKDLKK